MWQKRYAKPDMTRAQDRIKDAKLEQVVCKSVSCHNCGELICGGDEPNERVDCLEKAAELIQKYESIRDRVAERKAKAEAIVKEAEKKAKALLSDPICGHEVTKTHGDPSGNGDNHEECLICGEWASEKSARFT